MLIIKEGDASLVPPPWYTLIRWTCEHCGCEFQAESHKDIYLTQGNLIVVHCPTCDMGLIDWQPEPPKEPWRWPWQKREEQA